LEREADIDESSHNLDRIVMLGVIKEVALATLVRRMPVEDIKLRAVVGFWPDGEPVDDVLLAPPAKFDAREIVGYPAGKLVVNPGRLAMAKVIELK